MLWYPKNLKTGHNITQNALHVEQFISQELCLYIPSMHAHVRRVPEEIACHEQQHARHGEQGR